MIVVAIIGILATIAIASYQTYTVRAQVGEGIRMATSAKTSIVDAFVNNGEAPANRRESGMTDNAVDTSGTYVTAIEVDNGTVAVTFGNNADAAIAGGILYLTPYETPDLSVVWRCGEATAPSNATLLGTTGGGNIASYTDSTIDARFLPSSCR